MDSRDVRALRRKAVAMARETIRFTRRELANRPDLVALLDQVLAGEPIPELADSSRLDPAVLQVNLALPQIDAILSALIEMESRRAGPRPEEGNLSLAPTLADAWGQIQQSARLNRRST